MKVLLVLNYQREIPPFMITEIKCAKQFFEKIIYITPVMYHDNSSLIVSENVDVIQLGKKFRFKALCKLLGALFRVEVRNDIKKAMKEKRMGKKFSLHLAHELFAGEIVYMGALEQINKISLQDKITVLSVWFDSNAYSAARIKRKLPEIRAVSLAHSFEVDTDKNDFVDLSLNEYKHKYLDKVTFISKKVMEGYRETLPFLQKEFEEKMDVHYLGSLNHNDNDEEKELSGKFHICSCSGVTPVKRIGLILDALEKWNDGYILWTHIGDGPLWEEVHTRASDIQKSNPLVKIDLKGQYSNEEVHLYLKTHFIDLFVNVSYSEGIPVSIMEAVSYGIPAVATDVGGTSEIVDQNNGFLIDINCNGDMLRQILTKYKNFSDEEKKSYQIMARKKWEEKFNADETLPAYYREVVEL